MYNYSGYFIFLFVFIKVIFKKPEQVKSIILIQFSFFVCIATILQLPEFIRV